jgi:hypothetical protein
MIFQIGFLKPTREQIDEIRVKSDDSFCVGSTESFMSNFPMFEGFAPDEKSAMLLKMRNVEPHSDPWVSNTSEPRSRRALFWLIEGGGQANRFGTSLIFGAGGKTTPLKPGQFVVFNDAKDHWVMSEKLWKGAAIQLRPRK